jgi:hypothetical protein
MSVVKYMRIIYLLMLMIGFCAEVGATSLISGIVLDEMTGEPLPYATIEVQGKAQGTVSNEEGRFILDTTELSPQDTLVISYIGYETAKVSLENLLKFGEIYLKEAAGLLKEVQIVAQQLSVKEILKKVNENFKKNHQAAYYDKKRLFFHSSSRTPLNKENQFVLKKSNFVGLDKEVFNELFKKVPDEIKDYEDIVGTLYGNGSVYKFIPEKAVSLGDGNQKSLLKEIEEKLSAFFNDIEKSKGNEKIYYKVKTGILSKKIDMEDEGGDEASREVDQRDSLHFTLPTSLVKNELLFLLKEYTSVESKNWEFINSPGRYHYVLEEITLHDDEPVYKIQFSPRRQGLFQGTMYISTSSFAVLKLDFAFAQDKRSEHFQLLGVGHSVNYKRAHIIFQKGKTAYYPKFISAQQNEFNSLDRSFSVLKKEKRFLVDKELNEIKMDVDMSFTTEFYWELLVLEAEEIDASVYHKIVQPATTKYKREYAYTPEMWKNRTMLVPLSEINKYQAK